MGDESGNKLVSGETQELSPIYGEKGFCAVRKAGGTYRFESRSITELHDFIKDAQIAWIDYVVDDVETEVLATATELGFSELLIRNLLKDQRNGYEDFDDELGLLIPAIFMQGFDVRLEPLFILIKHNFKIGRAHV